MTRLQPWAYIGGHWVRRGRDPLEDYEPPPPPPPNLNPELPFELVGLTDALRASTKKTLPHWFVTFPLGGDGNANSSTWFTARMPGGATREADLDWLLRDRPYDPFSRPRVSEGVTAWQVLDKAWEIQQAIAAGFDGTFVDWLNLNDGTGDNRTGQVRQLMDAVVYLGAQDYFKVALMVDGNTSISQAANLDGLVTKTVGFAAHPAAWKLPDGRLLVAVYMPEGAVVSTHDATAAQVLAHWTTYRDQCAGQGVNIALWFCYQRGPWEGVAAGQGYGAALDPIAYGHGRWGARNPIENASTSTQNAGAPAYCFATFPGKAWLHPVSAQDSRPNQNKFEEARGFENLLASWRAAIAGNATWVQIPTWSDYAEHAHIGPSINHGWTWLDLCAYFSARYKLGYWPTIARDCVYVAHRIHPSSGFIEQVTVPDQVRAGSTPAADIVHALCFIRDLSGVTVRVTAGGAETLFTPGTATKAYGGDGVYGFQVPLALGPAGSVTAEIIRNGVVVARVVSPHAVTNTPVVQDMHYRAASSLRQSLGSPA